MPAEPPPPLRARLALPMRRRSQRQQRLLRAQPEPQCLLPKRRKAKKIQILFFTTPSTTSVPPGQRGFPGADLKAAVQKSTWPSSLAITQTLLCLCQFGLVLGEPRLRPFKIHGVFLPLISIDPLGGLGDRMDSGTKGTRRTRRKAPPFPDAFVVPLAGVHVYSCLGVCLEGGWQGICAKTISDLFKKKSYKTQYCFRENSMF